MILTDYSTVIVHFCGMVHGSKLALDATEFKAQFSTEQACRDDLSRRHRPDGFM